MKKAARLAGILAMVAVLVSSMAVPASAVSSSPYYSFNYDPYGNPTSAPQGYMPKETYDYRNFGIAKTITGAEDVFVYTDQQGVNTIFIADTANNQVIWLDENFKLIKAYTHLTDSEGTYQICAPSSVFVKYNKTLKKDEMFICVGGSEINPNNNNATGDCYVYTADLDGNVIKKFGDPTDATVEIDNYKPLSCALDNSGYLYIRVQACTEGLVVVEYETGRFMTYFGANKVVSNWQTTMLLMWKKIFSRSASENMRRIVPTELSNFFMDNNGFIYTTTSTADIDPDLRVRKLNALGSNILSADPNALVKTTFGTREKVTGNSDTRMIDIHVDDSGIMACLDAELGRVYLYDRTCTLLTEFGYRTTGSGNTQTGAVFEPVAVDKLGDNYIVLDKRVGTIVVYEPTYYINMLLEADNYYLNGLYVDGESYWREVIKYDANFARGYAAIGKSLLEQEKYREALEWLKTGQDRSSYSTAYSEYRTEFLRSNYYWLFPLIAVAIIVFVLLIRFIQKLLGVKKDKTKLKYE